MTDPPQRQPEVFVRYLERTRWFAGKGRAFSVTDVRRIGELPGSGDGLVGGDRPGRVTYEDGPGGTEHLPVPAGALHRARDPARPRLPRLVGGRRSSAGSHAYDAVHDREAMGLWLRAFAAAADETGGNRTELDSGLALPPAAGPRARPRHPLDALLRRAVELLGRLRRGLADQGLPQDHARASTPTSRSTTC